MKLASVPAMHKPADNPRPNARENKGDAPTPAMAQYLDLKRALIPIACCSIAWAISTSCSSRISEGRRGARYPADEARQA